MRTGLTLSIDFDGTIVEDTYPDVGQVRPYAIRYLQALEGEGHVIIINSNREGKYKEDAIEFLKQNNIPFHYFNENDQRLIDKYSNDSRKIGADLYIDDKSLFYNGECWSTIYNKIQEYLVNSSPLRV